MPDASTADNDAADFWDEYAMAADISEEEALEPRNLAEAKARPDWPLWEKAIAEELATLKEAGTWELVDAPEGANIVGSKWVFRAKKDAAGNVVRYKARLVAQGFSQVQASITSTPLRQLRSCPRFALFSPLQPFGTIPPVRSTSRAHT